MKPRLSATVQKPVNKWELFLLMKIMDHCDKELSLISVGFLHIVAFNVISHVLALLHTI